MRRTRSLMTLVLALAGFTLPAFGQTTLRIQDYPGVGNFLPRIAVAKGLCEKHGVKCELRSIPAAPLGVQTLLAGDIDVAFAPPEVIIQAMGKGADLKVLGSGATKPIFYLMASTKLATPNEAKGYPAVMQDFKGKRIGVTARGSAAEFQLVTLLQGAGLSASDVTILPAGAPNTALPAIVNGQIDGLMLFSPMDGFCEVNKVCRIVVDPRKGEGPADVVQMSGAAVVQVTTTAFARKNAAAIAGFKRAMAEAEAIAQDAAKFGEVMAVGLDTFKINAPNGEKVLEVTLRNAVAGMRFAVDPKALQHAADYMQRTGQIAAKVDTAPLLTAP
ncbi:MAG: hypothetical protein RIQ60_4171 [Pseudomonadota bacterium]